MKLSKDEITKEIRSTGADDPTNLSQRCKQAHEILVASGWPNEPVRPKLKDLLAAAHARNVKATLDAAAEREKKIDLPVVRRGSRKLGAHPNSE